MEPGGPLADRFIVNNKVDSQFGQPIRYWFMEENAGQYYFSPVMYKNDNPAPSSLVSHIQCVFLQFLCWLSKYF